MIGSLGEIVFKVTNSQISTFKNLNENYAAKWEKHNTKKQEQEFINTELATYSVTIPTNVRTGTSPELTFELLHNYCTEGKILNFVLNGKKFRNKTYILKSFKVTNNDINNFGQIVSATYDAELEEYGGDRKVEIPTPTAIKSKNTYKKQSQRKNNINYDTGRVY